MPNLEETNKAVAPYGLRTDATVFRPVLKVYVPLLAVALLLSTAGFETQAATFLFDATKAEMAGNADWVIDADLHNLRVSNASYGSGVPDAGGFESNPQRVPTPLASGITTNTAETYWDGALSAWAVDLVKRGHAVESLPYNGRITFRDATNLQDLTNYQAFVLVEPNILFTAAEKAAIINFVTNGGSLFIVSDHLVSDRNNDGADSVQILNDLMTNSVANNPFGIRFNSDNLVVTSSERDTTPGNLITFGPAGTGTNFAYHNGATMTLNTNQNASVRAAVWSAAPRSTNNVMLAYARYGAGRVVAAGDSSPFDDGTGDPVDMLFNGYDEATDKRFILNASLWLVGRPQIVQPPQSVTVVSGSNVTLTVTASGEAPLTFRWMTSALQSGGAVVTSGATTSSLLYFAVSPNNQGNYWVEVTNAYGSVTSAVATLTVALPPSITLQPRNRTNLTGTTALFSAAAGGTPPLNYQWRKGGTNLVGATNATLLLPGVQAGDTGSYRVLVTNSYGSVTSAVATLTLTMVPPSGGAALRSFQIQSAYVGYVNGEVGFAFRPAANITITNLGYAFDAATLPAAYTVQLRNAAGTVLASATFKTSNAPASQFIYTNISPVNLASGSTNFLAGYDADVFAANGTKFWLGRTIDQTAQDGGVFDVAPELDYLGGTVNGNPAAGDKSPFFYFIGPGFQFAVSAVVQPSRLQIVLTAFNTVQLIWPAADTLGQLQNAPNLNTSMTNVPALPVVIGTNRVVELPATQAQTFFRLIYP